MSGDAELFLVLPLCGFVAVWVSALFQLLGGLGWTWFQVQGLRQGSNWFSDFDWELPSVLKINL